MTWLFSGEKIEETENNKKKSQNKRGLASAELWKTDRIEVTERKGQYQVAGYSLTLDFTRFKENITRTARKFYGARTTPTIIECEKGSFWILLEFVKSGTKKTQVRQQAADYLPYGVAGFKVGIGSSGSAIEIYFSEFFGVGFVPQAFATSHIRIIQEALGLKKFSERFPQLIERKSLFEIHLSPGIALALAANEVDPPSQLMFERNKQANLGVIYKDGVVEFQLGLNETTFDLLQSAAAPVVVLESRERLDIHSEIDDLLIAGKMSRAYREIVTLTRSDRTAPYLFHRLCLLSVCGQAIQDEIINAHMVESQVERKLYLSHKVRSAALGENMQQMLTSLSELGKLLATEVPDIESVKSFDLVIPELLGDAWCPSNSKKAEACYERILQKCGDLPRIIRKMITIAKMTSDHVREFGLLLRLPEVERRRNELARIYLRMSELTGQHKELRGDPLDFAVKSLQYDRNHYQSALMAAELLNKADKPSEAISLLDQMLGDVSVNIPQKARSRLEYTIGISWQEKLGRSDLAERRFERAIALDDTHIESLARLESLYRAGGQSQKIGDLLEKQFDAFERNGDLESLKRVFEELVELFRGPMGQPKKAYELYQRMLALAIVEPEEIDKLMAWRDIEIDWNSIYKKLVENLSNLPEGQVSARYHIRLAEICRDKIGDPGGTYEHYLSALNHGGIDGLGFRMLVEKLAADQNYDQLAACFEVRLKQISGKERVELIVEIVSFPGVLSDPRRDQLAVEGFVIDEGKSTLLFQRLKFYQSMDDVDGIERFIVILADMVKAPSKVCVWIRNGIETLLECVDPTKFRSIDKLFRRLYEIDPDPASVLVDAITLFKPTMDAGRCNFYVREMLAIDEIPDLTSKLVARYLVGFDADLAKFHYLKAAASKRPEEARSDARVSCTIYKKLPGHHKMQEKSLHLLGMCEILTDVDMKDVETLAGINDSYGEAAKVLQKQADLTQDPVRKGQLLIDLGQMLWKELRDTGRARLAYVMAMNFVPNKASIKLILGQLAQESRQPEQELRALVDYILDEHSIGNLASYQRTISRMLVLGKEPYSIYKLIKPRLAEMIGDEGCAVVLKISNVLISAGLLNQDLFLMSFKCAVSGRFVDEAVDYWWRGLRSVQNRSGIKAYLAETQLLLKNADREDLLLKCFRAAIQNGVTDELPEKVRQEILVQYGLIMFDSDLRRSKALPVFKEAYKSDPEDNRSWLPIYFILEEQGDSAQQFLFLKEIVVRLRADARPLRQYPVTIESLEMQLRELAAQLGESAEDNKFNNSSDSFELSADTSLSRLPGGDTRKNAKINLVTPPEDIDEPLAPVSREQPSESVEQVKPMSMVSGDSIANVLLPKINEAQLTLVEAPVEPEAKLLDLSAPVAYAGHPVEIELPMGNVENFAERGLFPGVMPLDFSIEPEAAGPAETIPVYQPDPVGFIDLGALPDFTQSIDLSGMAGENSPVPLMDIDGGMSGFSLEDVQLPAMSPPAFGAEDVSLVIDFNEMPGPTNLEAPADFPGMDLGIGGEMSMLSDFEFSVTPEVSELNEVPPRGTGSASFSLELADDSKDAVMPSRLPPPPVVMGSSPAAVLRPGSESIPDLSGDRPAPPPQRLSFNLSLADEPEGEVSSIELAAALDIKAILPDEEYSSPNLLASGISLPEPQATSRETAAGLPPPPGSEESMQGSMRKMSAGLNDAQPNSQDSADWRNAVLSDRVTEDLTERLMRQAFANEVEKHVALQAIALISGNCGLLNSWHWRVWRNSKEYGYQLSGRDRFNSEFTSPALQSTLHQFIIACNPLMAKVFRERYSIEHLAKMLGVSVQVIEKNKKQMSWQKGILNDVGFHLYADRIAKRGYLAFNMPGLGSTIFFEGPKKAIYFDETYFTTQPPGALFHRILGILWSIRLQYFIPLALDPKKHVVPFLAEVHQKLEKQGISKLAEKITNRSALSKHIDSIDLRTLQSLKAKTGVPTEAQVGALWFAMQDHIFKLILSETLDLIGLLEAITSKDLTKSNSLKSKEIFKTSPYAKGLLEFSTKLVI